MAFRRSFKRKFTRPFSRPTLARKANKRRTWVIAPITLGCQTLILNYEPDPDSGCGQFFQLPMLDNTTLQNLFSDRATVVRILGDLWFTPIVNLADNVCDGVSFNAALNAHMLLRMGLRTFEIDQAGDSINLHPINSFDDWSEGRWKKTWQHYWPRGFAGGRYSSNQRCPGDYVGVCSDTSASAGSIETGTFPGGSGGTSFAEGTGFIDVHGTIPAISTNCNLIQVPEGSGVRSGFSFETRLPSAWHVHMDIKKRFPLRENQDLRIQGEFGEPGAPGSQHIAEMEIAGGIRVLLEF